MSVLVVGDANPDLVLRGDVVPRFGQAEQLLDDATLVIGGSAGITAHAFARLGRTVRIVAAIGDDHFGERTRADLAAAGVDVSALLLRSGRPTGLSVVLSRLPERATLTLPGTIPTLTAAEVRAAADATDGLRHVHVAALFLQPDLARELPAVLAELRARGVTTSLDTNDDSTGTWAGVDPLLPHLDVLLPNRREALGIARAAGATTTDDIAEAAVSLAKFGPVVVVKDGADGALACRGDELTHVAGTPRVPVDTTGAGDTFDAAFLDAWLDGAPLPACLRRAVTAGAFAVGAAGGTAGQPRRVDLDSE